LKVLKKYDISIAQLENKAYTFTIDGGAEFFNEMEMEAVKSGKFEAIIELLKSETMVNLNFAINGTVKLVCDRSLEEFDFPISTDDKVILKLGDHDVDLADGIRIINRNTQQINVAQDIYELISLAIPMKKLHPRFVDDLDESEEGFVVYSTKIEEPIEEIIEDPRWAILKKLK
jgi:uncharacterized metal-binding protein YceD (DUF177 family)